MHKSVGTGCDFVQLNEMLMCDVPALARKSKNYMMDECSYLRRNDKGTYLFSSGEHHAKRVIWERPCGKLSILFPTRKIY